MKVVLILWLRGETAIMDNINLKGVETGRISSEESNITPVPREEHKIIQVPREDSKPTVPMRLQKLAEEQLLLERWKNQRDSVLEKLIAKSIEYTNYLLAKEAIKEIETAINLLKDEIRVGALKGYDVEDEERNKKPYDGIVIKDYKKIEYNAVQAVTWAKENMPVALKTTLDKSTFEKFAKSNPEEESLDFVTFRTEPTATISQDLSQYLPKEDEDEN